MSRQEFVAELRRRYEVKPDRVKGNVVVGFVLKSKAA